MDKQHHATPELMVGSQGPYRFTVLENTTTRHAFWNGWIEKHGNRAWFCWNFGRIGSKGRSGHRRFSGYHAAHAALEAKIIEKKSGDYIECYRSSYTPTSQPATDKVFIDVVKECELAGVEPEPAPLPEPPVAAIDFANFDPLDVLWG